MILKTTFIKCTKKYKENVKETSLGKITKLKIMNDVYYLLEVNENGLKIAEEHGYSKTSYIRKSLLPYKSILNLKNNDFKTILNKLK